MDELYDLDLINLPTAMSVLYDHRRGNVDLDVPSPVGDRRAARSSRRSAG